MCSIVLICFLQEQKDIVLEEMHNHTEALIQALFIHQWNLKDLGNESLTPCNVHICTTTPNMISRKDMVHFCW